MISEFDPRTPQARMPQKMHDKGSAMYVQLMNQIMEFSCKHYKHAKQGYTNTPSPSN